MRKCVFYEKTLYFINSSITHDHRHIVLFCYKCQLICFTFPINKVTMCKYKRVEKIEKNGNLKLSITIIEKLMH